MQFGLDVPTTGDYADARVLAQLAVEAEEIGWDGVCLKSVHAERGNWLTIEKFRDCVAYVRAHRTSSDAPFDVVMGGETPDDRQQGIAKMHALQEAGATWWLEEPYGWSFEEFHGRIRNGPPRE